MRACMRNKEQRRKETCQVYIQPAICTSKSQGKKPKKTNMYGSSFKYKECRCRELLLEMQKSASIIEKRRNKKEHSTHTQGKRKRKTEKTTYANNNYLTKTNELHFR